MTAAVRLWRISGVLILLSMAGGLVDYLWWLLFPAAGAMMAGAVILSVRLPGKVLRRSARVVAVTTALLIAGGLAGAAIAYVQGYEPGVVQRATGLLAVALLAALGWFGWCVRAVARHRSVAWLVGLGLPFGWILDAAIDYYLPAGLFLAGAGFYLAMVSLAWGLLRFSVGDDLRLKGNRAVSAPV